MLNVSVHYLQLHEPCKCSFVSPLHQEYGSVLPAMKIHVTALAVAWICDAKVVYPEQYILQVVEH
jgi:hypothetical protein